jgi:hypothetical protein
MLDTLSGFKATSLNSTAITGYKLAGRMRASTTVELAFVGARLVIGATHLVDPRVAQVARLLKVPAAYIEAAGTVLRCDPALELDIVHGATALSDASVLSQRPEPSLIAKFLQASSTERAKLGMVVGSEVIWDDVLVPSL